MADLRVPPGRMQTGTRGGVAKRKRGRPPKVAVEVASVPAASTAQGGSASPVSSASESNRNLTELEERVNDLSESWETESLFEDVLDDLTEENNELALGSAFDPDACTPEEAVRYRQELRAIGPEEFCRRTVDAGVISAKKLLTAFGVRPPSFLDGEPDESYFGLLSLALSRELLKRAKLLRYNSVDDAVHLLQTSRNIIVLTGAGISTSLGIPDFRSKDIGLYSRLAHLGLSDPQEVFDINVFKEDPTIFYSVARDILPSTDRFTPTHAFIAMLQQKGKLLTNYSQNIDNLEAKAGIEPSKLIQCHGSFATASCVACGFRVEGESIYPTIKEGRIPRCPQCAAAQTKQRSSIAAAAAIGSRKQRKALVREANGSRSGGSLSRSSSFDNVPGVATRGRGGRPRGRPPGKTGRPRGRPRKQQQRPSGGSSSDGFDDNDDDDARSVRGGGVMKPDITFFGEPLPDEFSRRLTEHDRDKADLVIVIGTSLKVAPVSEVVPFMPPHVPQIYISRTPVHHINFDIDLLGDCDIVVSELCRRAGWDLKHEMVPDNQRVCVETPMGGVGSRHVFTDLTPGKTADDTRSKAEETAEGTAGVADVIEVKEVSCGPETTAGVADVMADAVPNVKLGARTATTTGIKTELITRIKEIPAFSAPDEVTQKMDETA